MCLSAILSAVLAMTAAEPSVSMLRRRSYPGCRPTTKASHAKHRKSLLEAGVALYEASAPDPSICVQANARPERQFGVEPAQQDFLGRSPARFRRFLQFRPALGQAQHRNGFCYRESGISYPHFCAFDERMPTEAYEVRLSPERQLYWLERRGKTVLRHDVEPGTSLRERTSVSLMLMLPIDWLL
jgi:putative cardiolipin synthase